MLNVCRVIDTNAMWGGYNRSLPLRFVTLDFYRFLAASGVVVYHIALRDRDSGLYGMVGRFNLFVDFFFILSGFVIARTYADRVGAPAEIGNFIRRRIARIYPLHLLTLALVLCAVILQREPANPDKYSLSQLPAQILLVFSWLPDAHLQWNYPAWSISVEFAMYLLFPLLMLLHRKLGIAALVVLSAGGFVALAWLGAREIIPVWDDNYSPARALPTFTIGILIALLLRGMRGGLVIGMASLALAVVLMATGANNHAIVAAFTLTVYCTAAGELGRKGGVFSHPVICALGDASYSIYMLHAVVLTLFFKAILKQQNMVPGAPIILALMGFIIAVSVVCYRTFERPMRDWLSGKKERSFQLAAGNLR